MVDKIAGRFELLQGFRGIPRHPAAKAIRHAPVGSRPPASQPERASSTSGRTVESSNVEELETLNATSELVLLEGRGICYRCAGVGSVPVSDLGDPWRNRTCPRCDGTGRRP